MAIPRGFTQRMTLDFDGRIANQVAWSMDGRYLAAGFDNVIVAWDSATGDLVGCSDVLPLRCFCIAWIGSGRIMSGSADKILASWDVDDDGVRFVGKFSEHTDTINCVSIAPGAEAWATCGNDHTARVWWPHVNHVDVYEDHTDEVNVVSWNHNGGMLASCSNDSSVVIRDVSKHEIVHVFDDSIATVNHVAWSPDGKTVVSGSDDSTIRFYDVESGERERILHGGFSNVQWVEYSPDGQFVAARTLDDSVRFWRTDTWDLVSVLREVTSLRMIPMLAFHPTEPLICTLGAHDRVIHVWEYDPAVLLSGEPFIGQLPELPPDMPYLDSTKLSMLLGMFPLGRRHRGS
jgi:WD40 repeat protein